MELPNRVRYPGGRVAAAMEVRRGRARVSRAVAEPRQTPRSALATPPAGPPPTDPIPTAATPIRRCRIRSRRWRSPPRRRRSSTGRSPGPADRRSLVLAGAAGRGAHRGARLAGPLPVRRSSSRSRWPSCWPRCSPRWPTGCAAGDCPAERRRRSPCWAGMALIAGALTLIGTQIAGQASTLSTNVVDGLQPADSTTCGTARCPIPDSWFSSSEWVDPDPGVPSGQPEHDRRVRRGDRRPGRPLPGRVRDRPLLACSTSSTTAAGSSPSCSTSSPATSRARVDEAARKGWRSLSSYVRATILVALVDGVGVLIVALILRCPGGAGAGRAGLHRRLHPARRGAGLRVSSRSSSPWSRSAGCRP